MTHLDDAALTTVEQLAALPVGTVLRDAWDSCVEMTPGRPLRRYTLPATVLYRPDLPSQDALHAAVREARAAEEAVQRVRELMDQATEMYNAGGIRHRAVSVHALRRALGDDQQEAT